LNDLVQFITKNPELIHLDLSNTELTESMLIYLVDAIAESKSLMAVHLDGNPGLT
jgi:hypothetical protein